MMKILSMPLSLTFLFLLCEFNFNAVKYINEHIFKNMFFLSKFSEYLETFLY